MAEVAIGEFKLAAGLCDGEDVYEVIRPWHVSSIHCPHSTFQPPAVRLEESQHRLWVKADVLAKPHLGDRVRPLPRPLVEPGYWHVQAPRHLPHIYQSA